MTEDRYNNPLHAKNSAIPIGGADKGAAPGKTPDEYQPSFRTELYWFMLKMCGIALIVILGLWSIFYGVNEIISVFRPAKTVVSQIKPSEPQTREDISLFDRLFCMGGRRSTICSK